MSLTNSTASATSFHSISPITPTVSNTFPLTTPFIPPRTCQELWDQTWTVTASRTTVTVSGSLLSLSSISFLAPILYSNPARPEYTACQPSGWGSRDPLSRDHYRPGVCPSGWPALDMGYDIVKDKTISTAWCCKSGFQPTTTISEYNRLRVLCVKPYWSPDTNSFSIVPATLTRYSLVVQPTTEFVHAAWAISWEASDLSTMSPVPPKLTENMQIPTWTPGMVIEDGRYDNKGQGRVGNKQSDVSLHALYFFLVAGIPTIFSVVLCLCGYCCFRERRKKKRNALVAEQLSMRAAQEDVNGEAEEEDTETETRQPPPPYQNPETPPYIETIQLSERNGNAAAR